MISSDCIPLPISDVTAFGNILEIRKNVFDVITVDFYRKLPKYSSFLLFVNTKIVSLHCFQLRSLILTTQLHPIIRMFCFNAITVRIYHLYTKNYSISLVLLIFYALRSGLWSATIILYLFHIFTNVFILET